MDANPMLLAVVQCVSIRVHWWFKSMTGLQRVPPIKDSRGAIGA